jgi:hypothetical protein
MLLHNNIELCRNRPGQNNNCLYLLELKRKIHNDRLYVIFHLLAGLNLSVFKAKSAYLCALVKSFSYKN